MRRRGLRAGRLGSGAIALGLPFLLLSSALGATFVNWPGYLYRPDHSSANLQATVITPANAAGIVQAWRWTPPAVSGRPAPRLIGSPTVFNGSVYLGTRSGWFYRLDEATGTVVRSVDLGFVTACRPFTTKQGISSTATVAADPARGSGAFTVYVTSGTTSGGQGGIYLWALDAADLHPVWSTDPVVVSTRAGAYSWSSPTVISGRIYVGISSQCDDPLVRGGLAEIDQASGALLNTYWTVPPTTTGGAPNVGGGIWTTAATSSDGRYVWVTTGNADETTAGAQPGDSYSIVRLDGVALARLGAWTVPGAFAADRDWDFGGSPTLFSGSINGVSTPLVGACNKNGNYYALKRSALFAGPVWTFRVGMASQESPFDACLAAAVWDSTRRVLFLGGNRTANVDGQARSGSIRALTPDYPVARRVLWDNGLPCNVIGSPSLDGSGILAVVTYGNCEAGATPALYLLDSRSTIPNPSGIPDAVVLKTIPFGSPLFAQPVFADRYLLVATSGNGLFAYTPGP